MATRAPRDYDPYVSLEEFRHRPDAMLKHFLRRSAATIKEAGRRAFFRSTPTHAARKRRGRALERRHALNPVAPHDGRL